MTKIKDVVTTIMSYVQRVARRDSQCSENERECDQRCALLEKQLAAERADRDQRAAAIKRAFDQEIDALGVEIAGEFHAGAAPLVAEWIAQPTRAGANALAAAYNAANSRALAEIGAPLWESQIVIAFATQLIAANPSATSAFAGETYGIVELAAAWVKALGTGAANIEQATLTLEGALQRIAAAESWPVSETATARFLLKKQCATHSIAGARLAAFGESQRIASEAANAKAYGDLLAAEREPLVARARRVLGSAIGI